MRRSKQAQSGDRNFNTIFTEVDSTSSAQEPYPRVECQMNVILTMHRVVKQVLPIHS